MRMEFGDDQVEISLRALIEKRLMRLGDEIRLEAATKLKERLDEFLARLTISIFEVSSFEFSNRELRIVVDKAAISKSFKEIEKEGTP